MLPRLHVVVAVGLAAAVVTCGGEIRDVDALEQALRQEYAGAQFEVGFVGGPYHLKLTVDTAVYGNYRLDDSQRRTLGEAMARFALDHYGAAANLDSISVQFVQERSGSLLSKSWTMMEEKSAVADLP